MSDLTGRLPQQQPTTGPANPFAAPKQAGRVPQQPITGGTAPFGPGKAAVPPGAPGYPTDSAFLQIKVLLDQYDLGSLYNWAIQQLQSGQTADQVTLALRETPQFNARFWMIGARQKAGLAPVSPAEVVAYEQQARELANHYGMSASIFTRQDIGQLIAHDVSATELESRLKEGWNQVARTSPEVRAAMGKYYGVNGDAALAAWFTDPTKSEPVLLQQAMSAEVGGTAQRFGFDVAQTTAERLAKMGVDATKADAGFDQMSKMASVFQQVAGDKGTQVTADIGALATLGGSAIDEDLIRQKVDARQAQGAGRVGVEMNPEKGFLGLGTAI